jgi:hypothetical protein
MECVFSIVIAALMFTAGYQMAVGCTNRVFLALLLLIGVAVVSSCQQASAAERPSLDFACVRSRPIQFGAIAKPSAPMKLQAPAAVAAKPADKPTSKPATQPVPINTPQPVVLQPAVRTAQPTCSQYWDGRRWIRICN